MSKGSWLGIFTLVGLTEIGKEWEPTAPSGQSIGELPPQQGKVAVGFILLAVGR